ncbi:MAG: FAD-dependent oxidoreductase [Solirubrobacterales bacterium]
MSARVLVIGGGVAGIEAAIALRELGGGSVEVELCSPREDFIYRPFAVGAPYGRSRPMRFGLRQLTERCGAGFRLAGIGAVDPEAQVAIAHDGDRLPYDYLIVACGARALWAVPGTIPFWGAVEEGGVQGVVRELRDGGLRKVAFTMPGIASWGLPVYELALLAASELEKAGTDGSRLIVVTPEEAPLALFGRRVGEGVGALLAERGIAVVAGTHPVKFEDGELSVAPGDPVQADAVVSLPRLEGRRIDGIPSDEEGFIAVDGCGWVRGLERVLAAGDVTTFPVKQGGLSTQQADVAAEAVLAAVGVGAEPEPFDPVLRAVLWTGAEPRYLYGRPSGGHGEVSELSEEEPPGWAEDAEDKIIGRYLTSFLAEVGGAAKR